MIVVANAGPLIALAQIGRFDSHGVVLRLSDLWKRLFLAESKTRYFEEKYHISLEELDLVLLSIASSRSS